MLPNELTQQLEAGFLLRSRSYRGRFAPSPTGPLHLGNLRTALVSWLRARLAGGTWLLRVDDLDTHRNRTGAVESFQDDLLWLGLKWDGPIFYQSMRQEIYDLFLSSLKACGMLYACRCSRKKLSEQSQKFSSNNIYPGYCRELNLDWNLVDDKLPSWRLKVGPQFAVTSGDVVVRSADGFISYNFATVVDDLTMGMSEIVRGNDLMEAMQAQLALIDSISSKAPKYIYVPTMNDANGKKLSKRDGSQSLLNLREKGFKPHQVIGYLASDLGLILEKSELTVNELLDELKDKKYLLERLITS